MRPMKSAKKCAGECGKMPSLSQPYPCKVCNKKFYFCQKCLDEHVGKHREEREMIHLENMQRAAAAELERKRGEFTIAANDSQQVWLAEGTCFLCGDTNTTVLNCDGRYEESGGRSIGLCQDCITSSFRRFEEGQRDAKTDPTN